MKFFYKLEFFLKKHFPLIILLFIFFVIFSQLLSFTMLKEKEDGFYSSGYAWGDLALHISIANSFSERGFIDSLKDNVVYSGEYLRYPFLMDFISGMLITSGVSIQNSLIIPSLIFILLFISFFYFLSLKITKSRLVSFLAPFIFLFSGSIFGLKRFFIDFLNKGEN